VSVWLNGTHGAGKTTTSALVQQLIPDSRVFDAEKVGETLVVETARHVLDDTGGTFSPL
jgi:thymidylate kinase